MTAKKKKIIISSAIALILIMSLVFYFSRKKSQTEYITEEAGYQDIIKTVSATGELKADSELNLNFEITGRLKSVAKVGEETAQGEAIGALEDYDLSQEVEKAKLALDKAMAEAGITDDKIEEADQAVSNAKKYLEGVEDLEDQKAEAAQQAYDDACDYYDDAEAYYNKVVEEEGEESSTAKYAKLTLTSALKSKNSAQEALETAEETKDLNILSAENSLKLAKDQRRTVESDFAQKSTNSVIETARVNYNLAQSNLEKSQLKSPVNGIITKMNYEAGEVIGSAAAGTPFGRLISYDLLLEANVPEADIVLLKKSQMAEVTFDSLSEEEKFRAEIIEIDPASTVIQDVVYYKVKLKMNNSDSRLKPGMSADIDVKIDERKNVLAVPQRAVENGEVKILIEGGKVVEKQVKTGLKGDGSMLEIKSGISQGDKVILAEKTN